MGRSRRALPRVVWLAALAAFVARFPVAALAAAPRRGGLPARRPRLEARARLGLRPLLRRPPAADHLADAGDRRGRRCLHPPPRRRGRLRPPRARRRSRHPRAGPPRRRRSTRSPSRRIAAWVAVGDRRASSSNAQIDPVGRQGRAVRHPAGDGVVLALAAGRTPDVGRRRVLGGAPGDARRRLQAEHRGRAGVRRRPAARVGRSPASCRWRDDRAVRARRDRRRRGAGGGGRRLGAGGRRTPRDALVHRRSRSAPTPTGSSPRRAPRAPRAGSGCCSLVFIGVGMLLLVVCFLAQLPRPAAPRRRRRSWPMLVMLGGGPRRGRGQRELLDALPLRPDPRRSPWRSPCC